MSTSPQQNTLINAAQNPTGKNLQEMAQLPIQNIPIPESARTLGQAAFESQVAPMRRGFGERLEQTTGELARRGIAFGGATGPGAQQVRNLMETQSELEAQVAGQVGSTLGMTLLDQAFQASESAKRFEESKEFAAFSQGLQYGTDAQGKPVTQLEAQKQLAEFGSQLDISTQEQLGQLNLQNQKSLLEFTTGMEAQQQKDFAEFMTNLDDQSRKDFLTFSTDLDIQAKKDIAQFMTGLDSTAQKDMATFMSNLNTAQAKDLATFTSSLDVSTQKELSDYAQRLRGGVNDNGEALNDVEIAAKMAEVSTRTQQTLNEMSRGTNPETGQAYTDFDMANIAANLEIDRAERQAEINKEMAEFATILDRGTDENGEPLDTLAFNELNMKMQNRLQTEFATKAFEAAAIAEYGANGVEIANNLAKMRGDSMAKDLSMLEAIEADTGFTDTEKQDLTRLIMRGAGWESEPVRDIIENSNSNVVAADFMTAPDAAATLQNMPGEVKGKIAERYGFTYKRKSEGFLGIETSSKWKMDTNEKMINKFNELWETDPEFRRMVG